jgi:hypothetical protein
VILISYNGKWSEIDCSVKRVPEMDRISFFRQERFDGGVRAGVGVNDVTVLNSFEPGKSDTDPSLLWYVDVQFEGKALPIEADSARSWLLANSSLVKQGLEQCAEHIEVGLDADDSWPFTQRIKSPRGSQGKVIVSGVRRLAEGELSQKLIETAEGFDETLRNLRPLVTA